MIHLGTGAKANGYVGVRTEHTAPQSISMALTTTEKGLPSMEIDCENCMFSPSGAMCSDAKRPGMIALRNAGIELGDDPRPDENILRQHLGIPSVASAVKNGCRDVVAPYLVSVQEPIHGT